MNEFTQILIVSATSIIVIIILLFALWVHIGIANELKDTLEDSKEEINVLKHQKFYYKNLALTLEAEIKVLKHDLMFQKQLTKTFSEGLDALTEKLKNAK